MNQLDLTIHDNVHNYNGSTASLADAMGMSTTILNNKACPTNEHHQFHPTQLIKLQQLTGDWSITDAFVGARDNWLMKQSPEQAKKGIHASMLAIAEEFGQVAHVVNEAMADSKLTERERRDCLKELDDVLTACEALKQALYREGIEIKAVS